MTKKAAFKKLEDMHRHIFENYKEKVVILENEIFYKVGQESVAKIELYDDIYNSDCYLVTIYNLEGRQVFQHTFNFSLSIPVDKETYIEQEYDTYNWVGYEPTREELNHYSKTVIDFCELWKRTEKN